MSDESKPFGHLRATVLDAGGGEVRVVVDRDAESYPVVGQQVLVTWLNPEAPGD